MVGDTDADVAAGWAAGCGTLPIEHFAGDCKRMSGLQSDLRATAITGGVELLLSAQVESF
jgi:hypothetical protein